VAAINGDIAAARQIWTTGTAHADHFSKPVALLFVAVLHLSARKKPWPDCAAFRGPDGPRQLPDDLPRGQRTAPTRTRGPDRRCHSQASATITPRTAEEVAAWFGGFDMIRAA